MKDRFRLVKGALIGAGAALVILLAFEVILRPVLQAFEAKTYDWRFEGRVGRNEMMRAGVPIDDVVIVDIDDRSLEKLGRFQQWPRDYHARLIKTLHDYNARVIAFDLLFNDPDRSRASDAHLVDGVSRAGNVYLAMSFSSADPDAFLYPMKSPPAGFEVRQYPSIDDSQLPRIKQVERFDGKFVDLYNAARGMGFANFSPDNDTVIRSMPLLLHFAGRCYPSLGLSVALGVLGAELDQVNFPGPGYMALPVQGLGGSEVLTIPVDSRARVLMDYAGSFKSFRYVSFYDVLADRVPGEFFDNKIVLVGSTAAGLYELRPVPFQGAFPGVEIHANVIYNLLNGRFIHVLGMESQWLMIGLMAAAFGIVVSGVRFPWAMAALVMAAAGWSALAYWAFVVRGVWLPMVAPVQTLTLTFGSVIVSRYMDERKDKRRILGMFRNYTSGAVVRELLRNPEMLKLGGERRVATAFFSDIKNFTTLSERLRPEQLVAVLNEYLSEMTDVILEYQGYVDKYEGDAIVAIFGIPVHQEDHALRACRAALKMQDGLTRLRSGWARQQKPLFEMRVGINSGAMIAGNIGSRERFDYTAIGDSVNLASRLEGANKAYGTNILISESTHRGVSNHVLTRELDFVRVKGKQRPVRIFELIGLNSRAPDPAVEQVLDTFARGLHLYRHQKWQGAEMAFREVLDRQPNDGPARTFVERCRYFRRHSCPPDWDGVFEMKTK